MSYIDPDKDKKNQDDILDKSINESGHIINNNFNDIKISEWYASRLALIEGGTSATIPNDRPNSIPTGQNQVRIPIVYINEFPASVTTNELDKLFGDHLGSIGVISSNWDEMSYGGRSSINLLCIRGRNNWTYNICDFRFHTGPGKNSRDISLDKKYIISNSNPISNNNNLKILYGDDFNFIQVYYDGLYQIVKSLRFYLILDNRNFNFIHTSFSRSVKKNTNITSTQINTLPFLTYRSGSLNSVLESTFGIGNGSIGIIKMETMPERNGPTSLNTYLAIKVYGYWFFWRFMSV